MTWFTTEICPVWGAATYYFSQNLNNSGMHLVGLKISSETLWTHTFNCVPILKMNNQRIKFGRELGWEVLLKRHFPLLLDVPSIIRKRVILAKISKVIH